MTCWPHSRNRRSSLSSEICFSLNNRTSGPQEDGAERAVLPPQRYGKGRAMAPLQRHLAAERELGFGCALQILDLDWHPVDHRAAHDRGAIQGPRLAHLEAPRTKSSANHPCGTL
jgi:hypothetical protein